MRGKERRGRKEEGTGEGKEENEDQSIGLQDQFMLFSEDGNILFFFLWSFF